MGTDPEMFLIKTALNEKVPAFHELANKKECHGNPFWDGFQGEFTVRQAMCHQEICNNIAGKIQRIPSHLDIAGTPIWRIPQHYLDSSLPEHVLLGCDPSYNIYNMKGRPVPDGRKLKVRFAGGHIHFALPQDEKEPHKLKGIVKALDAISGVLSVALAQGIDHPIRRQYYGLAGEFRLPPHGLEYRTLSNYWLYHPCAYHLTFDFARLAYWLGRSGARKTFNAPEESVINCINYNDVKLAKELLRLNKDFFDYHCEQMYGFDGSGNRKFWTAVDKGLGAVIPNFGKDIRKTWQNVISAYSQPDWRRLKV